MIDITTSGTEARVIVDIAERQAHGIAKYGTTVADNPLALKEWMQHAYEELLDGAVYLKRAMEEIAKASKFAPTVATVIQDSRWHDGPPPSVGWWPASREQDKHALRWWDGNCWSHVCREDNTPAFVLFFAGIWDEVAGIKWQHRPASWPSQRFT